MLGFVGREALGEGRYAIRQEFAHAWVEALVPADGGIDGNVWNWLTLDATAGADEPAAAAPESWWEDGIDRGRSLFGSYVSGFNASTRGRMLAAVRESLMRPEWLALLVVAPLVLFVRRLRGRGTGSATRSAGRGGWFGRIVDVLRAAGHNAGPGETPREFAAAAAGFLKTRPAAAALADVPREWADAYYADRYGGRPPSVEQRRRLDDSATALKTALTSKG